MQKSAIFQNLLLLFQMVLLFLVAVALAIGNNFRSEASLDWFQYWTSLSELKGNTALEQEFEDIGEWETLEGIDLTNAVELFLQENEGSGPTLIGSKRAIKIHEYASDKTLWIDARSPKLYEEGHIRGAILLHFYEQSKYFPEVQLKIDEIRPTSLVIYCIGKDCHDSKLLAQQFEVLGYRNLFIYTGGYDQWEKEGYPIEGNPKNTLLSSKADSEKPPGMYLEHLLLDLIPFGIGILFLVGWKKMKSPKSVWTASFVVGLFFLYASVPKILNPMVFAKNIWNYDLVPGHWINGMALILPVLESLLALCLMTSLFRKSAGGMIACLLIVYMTAVSANLIRGHEFQCGCFTEMLWFTDLYLEGWNDKVTLLLRDIGLLAMALFVCFYTDQKPELQGVP